MLNACVDMLIEMDYLPTSLFINTYLAIEILFRKYWPKQKKNLTLFLKNEFEQLIF